jgi:alpha-amylase
VVLNNSSSVKSIHMNTGRFNKSFYHLATIKWTLGAFLVVYGQYNMYGDKAVKLFTGEDGIGAFPADGETVSIWIEDGVGLS